MDTIFATSSGAAPAAIAIVRISGPRAGAAGLALAGSLPADRTAGLRALHDPRDGRLLDRALILSFPAPRSATGEDVVELHVHGGRAVVTAVEQALAMLPGLRRAAAGEFTRRALGNGLLDLTEAEGLGDLLAAETEGQRRAALRIAEGGLRASVQNWAERLIAIAAEVEAQLDFSDEEDVAEASPAALIVRVTALATEIEHILAQPPVERLKDGLRVVLGGPPNSGKSTLLNALAQRDVAIVSPVAGTTRDRIEAPVMRDGVAYVLTDTAGLVENTADPVEQMGVARARSAMAAADILLWLGETPPPDGALWIGARADMPERASLAGRLAVSAVAGTGLSQLWAEIARRGAALLPSEADLAINGRQRILLVAVLGELSGLSDTNDLLVLAEHLRRALRTLDSIIGTTDVEQVLDAVFAGFCIGK